MATRGETWRSISPSSGRTLEVSGTGIGRRARCHSLEVGQTPGENGNSKPEIRKSKQTGRTKTGKIRNEFNQSVSIIRVFRCSEFVLDRIFEFGISTASGPWIHQPKVAITSSTCERSSKRKSGVQSASCSRDHEPVAIAIVRAPKVLPQVISCPVSPMTSTWSG